VGFDCSDANGDSNGNGILCMWKDISPLEDVRVLLQGVRMPDVVLADFRNICVANLIPQMAQSQRTRSSVKDV
jgi:hypothetical protein